MTTRTKAELEAELAELAEQLETASAAQADQLEAAQGLISNAADWTSRTPESKTWRTAARRWLDEYSERLRAAVAERDNRATEPEPQGPDQGEHGG